MIEQCDFYYYSWSNSPRRRCKLVKGHRGEHEQEIIVIKPVYESKTDVGWRKS